MDPLVEPQNYYLPSPLAKGVFSQLRDNEFKRCPSASTDGNSKDNQPSNFPQLLASLPSKVYENCQRTARVIMLSQLEKTAVKSKKQKAELVKQLKPYLPLEKKNENLKSEDYTGKTGYYMSLHYSRVRIGQRNFINNILLNPIFMERLQEIFKEEIYIKSEKARRNQNSQVPFETRKQVISGVINQYKKKFHKFFSLYQQPQKSDTADEKVKNCPIWSMKEQSSKATLKREQGKEVPLCLFYYPFAPSFYPAYFHQPQLDRSWIHDKSQ